MLVGTDFDNTIVCCDQLFHRAAVEKKVIGAEVPVTKDGVRDYLRHCGREEEWTELQGYVYGVLIGSASSFPGVLDFFATCKRRGIPVCIISHKTRHPFLGQAHDLHRAAHGWLKSRGFYNSDQTELSRSQVFFELSKQDKLDRIARLGCSHFIDDLPEFLMEPGFPRKVERILFDPTDRHPTFDGLYRATSWKEIEQCLIGQSTSD